jgi:hypothetical protein
MKLEFSQQTFEKYSNVKCHENPSSGSLVVSEIKGAPKGGSCLVADPPKPSETEI